MVRGKLEYMKNKKRFIALFVLLYLIGFIKCYAIDLTLNQAIQLSLKNNSNIQIEKKILNNLVSEINKQKADYIPKFEFNIYYDKEEDDPTSNWKDKEIKGWETSLHQKVPNGGQLSVSYNSELKSLSSYEMDSTTSFFVDYFFSDDEIDSLLNSHSELYYNTLEARYTHKLLKNGLFGPNLIAIESAKYDHLIQKNTLSMEEINLIRKVKLNIYELVKQQKLVEANNEIYSISKEISNLVLSKCKLGIIAEKNKLKAQFEINNSHEIYLESLQEIEKVHNSLQGLLGIKEKIHIIEFIDDDDLIMPVEEFINEAMDNNKKIRKIKSQIQKQEFNLKVAKNQIMPELNILSSYKMTGKGDSYDTTNNLDGKGYMIGIVFSQPLYNKKSKENYNQVKRKLKILRVTLKTKEMEIYNFVNMLVEQIKILKKRIETSKKQIEISKENFDIALKAFEKGLFDLEKLYRARDDLVNTEKNLMEIQIKKRARIADLNALMGN